MPDNERWVPDESRRRWASTINPSDVECLLFGGPQMGGFIGYDPIIVYDRRLIELFVKALKQASLPAPPTGKQAVEAGLGVNQLVICFKQRGNTQKRAESVMFFPYRPETCFGPAFYRALGELSLYQADRVRQKARELAPQVVAVEVVGGKVIRDAPTVHRLLSELQQLDEKAFVYTEQAEDLPLRVHLRGRKQWQVTLMVSSATVLAARERRAPPPLPPTLWRQFEQVTSSH